jgi:peptidoglycan/LPS O-acetylase OafA/YrhL
MNLRRDIQALRALAVLAVFAYHLRPSALTGGFVGVDVFFVLSGFLISAHLFQEFSKTGSLNVVKFWARRARRLLPASFVVLVFSAVSVWLIAPTALQERFYRDIGAATFYVANWVFAADSIDYLAADNSPSIVQHFWSLGVEEQLYVIWPVVLLIVWGLFGSKALAVRLRRGSSTSLPENVEASARKSGFKAFAWVLGAITVLSFAYSSWLVYDNNPVAYFSTFSRAWQFGAGALLALAVHRKGVATLAAGKFGLSHVAAWVGWLSLGGYMILFEATDGFPGWYALVPVIATLLIIWAGDPRGPAAPAWFLHLRPVQFIGDASYSIYLWHWPLIVLVGFSYSVIPVRVAVIILVATLVLSALSMRFVENPFRFGNFAKQLAPSKVFFSVATTMVLLFTSTQVASAQVVQQLEIARQQAAETTQKLLERAEETSLDGDSAPDTVWDSISCMGPAFFAEPDCAGLEWETIIPAVGTAEDTAHDVEPIERIGSDKGCLAWGDGYDLIECVFGKRGGTKVALIGDSHAYHWLPAFSRVAEAEGWELHFLARAGCPANAVAREAAGDHVRGCFDWQDQLDKWAESTTGLEHIIVANFAGSRFVGAGDYGAEQPAAVTGYQEAWASLIATGAEVMIMKDTPFISKETWDCVVANADQMSKCDVPLSQIEATFDNSAAAAVEAGLGVIDFTSLFCREQMCPMSIGGIRVYRDSNHMSGTFSFLLSPYLARELNF